MKKRLLVIALTTLAMTACSLTPAGEQEKDSSGNTIVKIMFHVNSTTAEGKAYKMRLDAFNNAYKEEKIKAVGVFQARTGDDKVETALINMKAEGTLPDIVTFDAPNCASYASKGYLYDFTDALTNKEKDTYITLNTYNGKVYGIPIQESSAGFYYNKSLFSKAGIDVSGYTVDNPWTYDDFKNVCKKLKESGKI